MKEDIVLGGGCFWCIEAIFKRLKGIKYIQPGFSGGDLENPSYEEVCSKETGHIEVIYLSFDNSIIKLEEILEIFFIAHDPTSLDKQGGDIGYQYKSVVFVFNQEQREIVQNMILRLERESDTKIVTEVRFFESFYTAGSKHENYYELNKEKNPYCKAVISPKLKKIEKEILIRNLNE